MHFGTHNIHKVIYKLYNVYKQQCLVHSALEALAFILVMIMIAVFGNLLFLFLSGIFCYLSCSLG